MVSLTPEETMAFVEKLATSGKGDPGRLAHILTILNEGRQLYNSDKKYLDAKFLQEIGIQEKPKEMNVDILSEIQHLISSGIGDTGRLQFILEFLKQGKPLYKSDGRYLESKLGHAINYGEIVSAKQDSDKTKILKSQASSAIQKIANLESTISKKMDTLQATHKLQGALPRGFSRQSQSLDQIQKQLVEEESNLTREKTEAEKIKIEQSKLTQIILDRQEFEKQVKLEKEQIKKQIDQERQRISEQNKLIVQIKAQESQLEQAKRERDSIILQLRHEQEEITRQAEKERSMLAEQALAAKRIQQEKEQLENIKQENKKISEETKSQERYLGEQIKQEKEKLVAQAKLLKTITDHERFLAAAKQKQTTLSQQIIDQKKKLISTTPSISQIKSDQELLDKIFSERVALESQIKSAGANLKLIKKEKTSIEKQIKAQKMVIARTKKKEETKIKRLQKKKKIMSKSIISESEKIKKIKKI